MAKMTQEAARLVTTETLSDADVVNDIEVRLKEIEVEGARRMQSAIVALLVMSGHVDALRVVLALRPEEICKGESIRETLTPER